MSRFVNWRYFWLAVVVVLVAYRPSTAAGLVGAVVDFGLKLLNGAIDIISSLGNKLPSYISLL